MKKIVLILVSAIFISWNYKDDYSFQVTEADKRHSSLIQKNQSEEKYKTFSNCFQNETNMKKKKVEYYWDDPDSFVWE